MKIEYTDNGIKAGDTEYSLASLHRYKLWMQDNHTPRLVLRFIDGSYNMMDVEADLSFKDMEDNPVNPEYYIITWMHGMAKPECTVKVDGKYMRATFEMGKPKKRNYRSYLNLVEDSDEETVPDSDTEG